MTLKSPKALHLASQESETPILQLSLTFTSWTSSASSTTKMFSLTLLSPASLTTIYNRARKSSKTKTETSRFVTPLVKTLLVVINSTQLRWATLTTTFTWACVSVQLADATAQSSSKSHINWVVWRKVADEAIYIVGGVVNYFCEDEALCWARKSIGGV